MIDSSRSRPVTYALWARAEGKYVGVMYSQVSSDNIETGNLGLIVGASKDKAFGFEFFYVPTISEDENSLGSFEVDITIDAYGILGYYKTGSGEFNAWVKIRGGRAVVGRVVGR